MPTKRYHHGALEQALTDAAIDVVRSNGVEAIALRDLAKTVGVSASAVYRHFPSRDHLVCRVSQRAREALADELLAAAAAAGGARRSARRSVHRFEAIGRAYVLFAKHNPQLFEAAFVRCGVRPAEADDPDAWGILIASIDEMIAAGAIPASRRTDGPVLAWAAVHGLANIVTIATWPDGLSVDDHIEAVVGGITRALR
jgi:AcrR family transcriptional regulator